MDKNKKNAIVLSIVAVVTLITLVVGATYAYFKAQGGTGSSADVNVTTYTTDMLTFTTGNAISLYADQSSFGQEKGSLSGETFAKATLVANNKTNEATDNYYVYFNIENNTFKYTLGEDKPELILTVTGPDGNEVTELPGLTHKVVQDRENKSISGFDVTTTNGIITIANKKTITAKPNAEEQYTLKLTFVNYEGDQTANATSTLSAKVMIQKEEKINSLASYITNLYTGTQGENGIYYHDANLTNGASDNSYRFAGADVAVDTCTFNGENVKSVMSSGESNKDDCRKVYIVKGDGLIGLVDDSITRMFSDEKPVIWTNGTCKTIDGESVDLGIDKGELKPVTEGTCKGKSYRAIDAQPAIRVANLDIEYVGPGEGDGLNNYVCFGSTTTPCPEDNLYRIIGVFDGRVKLIRNKSLGKKAWDSNGSNTWSTSSLNNYLNNEFINTFDDKIKDNIDMTTWKVGGGYYEAIVASFASKAYQIEVKKPYENNTSTTGETEYSKKIGLMYVSDFYYATSPIEWQYPGVYQTSKTSLGAIDLNWMHTYLSAWSMTRNSESSDLVYEIKGDGLVSTTYCTYESNVRPTFYLKSTVKYKSGTGDINNPIFLQ